MGSENQTQGVMALYKASTHWTTLLVQILQKFKTHTNTKTNKQSKTKKTHINGKKATTGNNVDISRLKITHNLFQTQDRTLHRTAIPGRRKTVFKSLGIPDFMLECQACSKRLENQGKDKVYGWAERMGK